MQSFSTFARSASLVVLATLLRTALGNGVSGSSNIALYWGQNSYGSSGSAAQQDLATYCANSDIDIIPMAFLYQMTTGEGGEPVINFANSGNSCSTFSGTELLDCPQIGEDITTCQSQYGKKILLSVGGATYTEGGFSSESQAQSVANQLWGIFGPNQNNGALRPFGDAVIDGFDMDFESTVSNTIPFAQQLRSNMDSDTSKTYLLTAAPQCPFPDAADSTMLNAVSFDAVFVQFYNNYCGLQSYTSGSSAQNNFDFSTWDSWAKSGSANPNIKVLLGVPGGTTGAGSGYEDASTLSGIIQYCQQFSSFGGVMMWDASQVWANNGFLSGVASALGSSSKRDLTTRSHPRQFKP